MADHLRKRKAREVKNPLSHTHPEIATEWHPTKNGTLRPDDVTAGSHRKVWWKCSKGDDHEWEASIAERARGNGCVCCSGHKTVPSNCLSTTHPALAKEWHPIKNGSLASSAVTAGSNKKVWWRCHLGHEWEATVSNRTLGRGCPYCANKKVDRSNCLTTTHPQLVAEWHPTRNGDLRRTASLPAVEGGSGGNAPPQTTMNGRRRSVIGAKATAALIAAAEASPNRIALRQSIRNLSRNGTRRKTATSRRGASPLAAARECGGNASRQRTTSGMPKSSAGRTCAAVAPAARTSRQ